MQEAGQGGSAKGKLERFPNHLLQVARQSGRRSDILAPAETVAPLVLPSASPVCFQGVVVVVAAAAKNMVLWEEAEIGKEGIAQGEGNKIVVGMVVAEVVRECMSAVAVDMVVAEVVRGCMSEVAVGLDEHILVAVMKGDTGDGAELDEGVGAGIAGWETEPAEADTGKAAETMENNAVVVARVVAHNYGAYKIADMIEEAEMMFAEEERILAIWEHIVGEAEKRFAEGEHILAAKGSIVVELGPAGNGSIASVLARDGVVALGCVAAP